MYYSILVCTFLLLFNIVQSSFSQTKQTQRPKVGLVLSGGAAKGIAHIGVLKVLEKAGLSVDYIGGTSMGSIIGGLYAIGYDATDLEKLVVTQNWKALFGDEISLTDISIEEKEAERKFFVSIPSEGLKIFLPKGLSSGQNITTLLSGLIWPYHEIIDFNDLPIPFLCIASDIINGKQEVLRNGYLLDAIRASMAIPTVFTPVEINGKIFVDGGLINNFPVQEVKNMGADIIIGADCGFRSYKIDEINSLTSVIEQSLYILAVERNDSNRSICDILIDPDFRNITAMDFLKASELIKAGEDAAMLHFEELKQLADSINNLYGFRVYKKYNPVSYIYISAIEAEGLKRVSWNLLLGNLKIPTPTYISLEELNAAINRAYGSQFFETVSYKIEKQDGFNILKIIVKEKPDVLFRLGGHYDTDFDASLLLNATIKNSLIKGSKLILDLKLGGNPAFDVKYIIPSRYKTPKKWSILFPVWKLGWIPDLEFEFATRNYITYEYFDGHKTAKFDFQNTFGGINFKSRVSNSLEIGLGAFAEYTKIIPDIYNSNNTSKFTNTSLNSNLYIKAETFNKYIYPSKGHLIYSKLEFIKDIDDVNYSDVYKISLRFDQIIPLSKKISLIANCYGGYTYGDSIPADYLNYMGGLIVNNYKINMFPFVGMELTEMVNKNVLSIGLDFQYEIFRNQFLQVRANIGKATMFFEDIFLPENIVAGYGLTYGYRSLIGPLEFTVMKNNLRGGLLTYVNIGFWF